MRVTLYRIYVVLMALMFGFSTVAAQDDCPTIVQNALKIADTACAATGRNQACYGNITLKAVPQPGVSSFTFTRTGDIVNVADVQSLTLSSLDAATKQWGVALLKIQANIPDTLPGQNIAFLLFGDVQIQNAVTAIPNIIPTAPAQTASSVLLPLKIDDTTKIWSTPLSDAEVVGRLSAGQTVQVDGKDETSAFLHIQPVDGLVGWIYAGDVTVTGDIGTLSVLNTDGTASAPQAQPTATTSQSPSPRPMQAFYFKTGLRDRPCLEAPDSGILIQSPKGVAGVELTANGVDITLGSTAYFQARPGGDMTIYVLEGHATASAFNKTVTVPAGTWVRIPMDTNLQASGPPGDPEAYDRRKIAGLPLPHLPDVITSASPLPDDDIAALNRPAAGFWILTYDQQYIDVGCAADTYNGGFATEISYDSNGVMSWYSHTMSASGYGVYESSTGSRTIRIVVTSPTHIEGQNIWIVPGCATLINNFHLELEKAAG